MNSTRAHILKGTFRRDRHSLNGPQQPTPESLRTPPKHLSREAAAIWRKQIEPLLESRVITVIDASMFADLCQLEADYLHMSSLVREKGFLIDSAREDGAQVKNPGWQICRDMLQHINTMRRDFGMSPVSRSKIEASPPPDEGSELDEF